MIAGLAGMSRNEKDILNRIENHAELLQRAVYLHVHVTRLWLAHTATPARLLRRVVFLARRLAQERDEAPLSPCCSGTRGEAPRGTRSYGAWQAGLVCPSSPSGILS